MSFGGLVSTLGISLGANILDTVLVRQNRNIAGIFPDVVIEEHHRDEVEVTAHPVERGAPISDHAFVRPAELVIRAGWSNSTGLLSRALDAISERSLSALVHTKVNDVYAQLLRLQQSLQPMDVVTGKRSYKNMMLVSLSTSTTKETENSLIVEAVFREILLVTAQVSDRRRVQDQLLPGKTADIENKGTLQGQLANVSIPGLF